MGMPTFPNVTPTINLSRPDVINLLLASIAFEELGLAHIINAEAEKIQSALGTLPANNLPATTFSDLLAINESVNRTLKTVLKKEMLLLLKLEDILEIPVEPIPPFTVHSNTATVTATAGNLTVQDSDLAFYHTTNS